MTLNPVPRKHRTKHEENPEGGTGPAKAPGGRWMLPRPAKRSDFGASAWKRNRRLSTGFAGFKGILDGVLYGLCSIVERFDRVLTGIRGL